MTNPDSPIALILGAGTMGAGIAQVAALGEWQVLLSDTSPEIVAGAIQSICRSMDKLVEKGKLTAAQRDAAGSRLHAARAPNDYRVADLVIEAIVENLAAKMAALSAIVPLLKPGAIIATNTSSLSVTSLGESIGQPHRTVGMHFFNPAPILPLVEVIAGLKSDPAVVDRAAVIAQSWGKTVVRAKDTPGFIVNRVARPYYLESWRMVEEAVAAVDEIDRTLRDLGGFRMGPFELTDMIGQDVNTASSRSVWGQLGRPPRLAPSALQESLVAQGRLGRKTRRGAYDYSRDPPVPAISIDATPFAASRELEAAVDAFAGAVSEAAAAAAWPRKYLLARVLVAVINEAAWTCHDGVASAADIDTALKLATSYPRGPLEWARNIGYRACGRLLEALNAESLDRRFDRSPFLNDTF